MMARWLCTLVVPVLLFFGNGCCCVRCGPGGPGGNCCVCMPCLPCLPKPIVWNGGCNECGPCPGQSCANYCGGGCGLFGQGLCPWLRSCWSCGRGCGEVYCDEWKSDPPDCCDPCDKCFGQFTGQQGYCCLGPFQRLLAALHGYTYCPRPNCGPWRPIFGRCGACDGGCGAACGCGGAGCASCGGVPAHGADIYYGGGVAPNVMTTPKGIPVPPPETTNIMEENWDAPRVKPQPGQPIHNAQQPPRNQTGRRMPQKSQPMSRPASQYSTVVGAGLQQSNYEP